MGAKVIVYPNVKDAIKLRLDQNLALKAAMIEVKAKAKVPVDKGLLQSSGSHERRGFGRFRIWFNKEYAGFQERGRRVDGSHVVRRYTTPGTGAHYLARAAGEVQQMNFGKVTK